MTGHHHGDGETCCEGDEESRHFREVVQSFVQYSVAALTDVTDFAKSVITQMAVEERRALDFDGRRLVDDMAAAIKVNQEICDMIVMAYGAEDDETNGSVVVQARNVSKVRSTLRQYVREWSSAGADERNQAFGPLLAALATYLPQRRTDGSRARVLCPGSGLGRLVWEVCRAGYSCQGNEFSYQMLLGANLVLNCAIDKDSLPLFPYIMSRPGRKTKHSQFTKIQFPDEAVHETKLEEGVEMSMTAGEFVEAYKSNVGTWDGLATCFFIDTAKNIMQYIRLFAQIVRHEGVWTNIGPLLYHFADQTGAMSIELSWQEVKRLISKYFDIVEESEVACKYTSSEMFMTNTVYRCIHFVAIRNSEPTEGSSNPVYP